MVLPRAALLPPSLVCSNDGDDSPEISVNVIKINLTSSANICFVVHHAAFIQKSLLYLDKAFPPYEGERRVV